MSMYLIVKCLDESIIKVCTDFQIVIKFLQIVIYTVQ